MTSFTFALKSLYSGIPDMTMSRTVGGGSFFRLDEDGNKGGARQLLPCAYWCTTTMLIRISLYRSRVN